MASIKSFAALLTLLAACSSKPAEISISRGVPTQQLRISVDARGNRDVRLTALTVNWKKSAGEILGSPEGSAKPMMWTLSFEPPDGYYSADRDAPRLPIEITYGTTPKGFWAGRPAVALYLDKTYVVMAKTTAGEVTATFRVDGKGMIR